MIRFDKQAMLKASQRDIKFKQLIHDITFNRNTQLKKRYEKYAIVKDSFIINPEYLLLNELGASDSEIDVYIDLCSRRSFFDYKMYNHRHLNLIHNPYDVDSLKLNRLLDINKDVINFKYE